MINLQYISWIRDQSGHVISRPVRLIANTITTFAGRNGFIVPKRWTPKHNTPHHTHIPITQKTKTKMQENDNTREIYYISDRFSSRYYHIIDDNTVQLGNTKYSIPRHRFLDFIATAKILGLKAGKL